MDLIPPCPTDEIGVENGFNSANSLNGEFSPNGGTGENGGYKILGEQANRLYRHSLRIMVIGAS
jgi:hypothetical protein